MGLTAADISGADAGSFLHLGQALDRLQFEANLEAEKDLAPGHEVRVRGGRTYLYLLGYLERDSGQGKTDSALVGGIRQFQAEAGLAGSGELDNATWQALGELCQYHSPCPVQRYFRDQRPTTPLLRAVCLRLFSYGLLTEKYSHKTLSAKKTAQARSRLEAALQGFSQLVALLGLGGGDIAATLTPATASLLLYHDGLTEGIQPGPSRRGFRVFPQSVDASLSNRQIKSLVGIFTKNLALVELWMLGYETRPGQFKIGRFDAREADDSLIKALKKFCADRGLRGHFKTRNSVTMGCWFFEEVRCIHREYLAAGAAETDPETLAELEQNPKFQKAVQKRYVALGTRIFDGVKRIFGWFKYAVKKTFKFLKRTILNTARIVRQEALAVYQRLQSVARALQLGASFYAQPVFAGSDPRFVYVRHDADLDFDVFVNSACPRDRLDTFFARLGLRTGLFELACLLTGKLLDLLTLVFQASRLVTGWLALLLTLIKLARWLRDVHSLGGEAQSQLEQLYSVRAVEAAFSA